MPRSLDYRSTSQYSADEVYATMVDPDYLRARLDHLGGSRAELLEHQADPDGARYRLRHGLAAADLPPLVAALVSGDIVIERTETIVRKDVGRYAGDVSVDIHGTPASAAGRLRLVDLDGGGSELDVHADVTVNVPLVGGRIEATIADQIKKLLAAETAFTLGWLGH
ncbi:MAG: DUF2505 domain-containing protein [Pseudonocardia sp.]